MTNHASVDGRIGGAPQVSTPFAQWAPVATAANRQAPPITDRRYPPHLDGFMQLSFGRRAHDPDHARACPHWPLDGPARIRATCTALLELALVWDHAGVSHDMDQSPLTGCIDVSTWDSSLPSDIRSLQWAGLPDRIEVLRRTVQEQQQEYTRVAAWLRETVRVTRLAALAAERSVTWAGMLADDQRVIAKDAMASDLNALVARLLGHALRALDRLDRSPDALALDLAGARRFGAILLTTAEVLDRAGTLAQESTHFTDDADRRFRAFRQQVAVVAAMSRQDVAPSAQ